MSTVLSILLAVAVAGLAAWLVRRKDLSRDVLPTECSQLVTDAFVNSSDTPDSVLLGRLVPHRERCLGDAGYVDQARRLMTNTQRFDEARQLLKDAGERNTFHPDELSAERAWVDAAEGQGLWADGQEEAGRTMVARATDAANQLREKWPEWSLPYRILEEASRSGAAGNSASGGTDYYDMERTAKSGKLNGAWIRSQSDWQPVVLTFVVTLLGMLALVAAADGFLTARQIMAMNTSEIAKAAPGYVELKGTLHPRTPGSAVIGPHTKESGVWYELATNSGGKKSTTRYERSAETFILRDATGDVIINPQSISVQTRHSATRFGNSTGMQTGERVTERMLKPGDTAYALGELSIVTTSDNEAKRTLNVAKDGQRLFVSNYSESELVWMEKVWMTAGGAVFAMAMISLVWAYYQRYHVTSMPGTLF